VSAAARLDAGRSRRLAVPLALATVYVVWGSTYLALRFMVEEMPALMANGVRFALAGLLLLAMAKRAGTPMPTPAEWWGAAQVGVFLLVGGVGLVAIAESLGVGSGLAATAVAVMPVWAALWAGVFGSWPSAREWAGLALGLVGVVILTGEGDFQGNLVGTALVIVAPISWAFGSVWSGRIAMPKGTMSSSAQMLAAAPVLLLVGWVRGERWEQAPGLSGWLALLYLATFGSALAYTAYIYLLQNVRPTLATSYAYVNPVVAVLLGIWLAGETLSGEAWIALPIILGAVALVAGARSRPTIAKGSSA
jgi:drug/metabolite transporter (DMT)-like permease